MSAGRSQRRALRQGVNFEARKRDIELSAATRQRLADIIAAHDDPAVTVAEFVPLMLAFVEYTSKCPEPERREASYRVMEHAARSVTGRQKLTIAGMARVQP